MIEVEVFNFQSIQHTKVVIDGFTVVLGPSDIGKSAFARAVKFALTNASGTSFVRHGNVCDRVLKGNKKCKCTSKVILKFPEQKVTWEKGDSVNVYTVVDSSGETKTYEGLDRGTPSFLAGFQRVAIGNRLDLIQIPKQFEPIFLLNESGGVVADVLSDLASLGKLNEAADLVSKDRREAVSRRKLRDEDLANLRRDLERFDDLDSIPTEVLQASMNTIDTNSQLLAKVNQYSGRNARLQTECVDLDVVVAGQEIPEPPPLQQTLRLFDVASSCLTRQTRTAVEVAKLEKVVPETLPDYTPLKDTQQRFLQVSVLQKTLSEIGPTFKGLNQIDALVVPSTKELADAFRRLQKLDSLVGGYNKLSDWFRSTKVLDANPLPDPSGMDLVSLEVVTRYETRLQVLVTSISMAESMLKTVTEQLDATLSELNSLGVCPVCNQPISDNHLLHLGAV